MKKKGIILLIALLILSPILYKHFKKEPPEVFTHNGVVHTTKVNKDSFQVYTDGEWKNILIKGVNLGITQPGKSSTEANISEDEYYRWFEKIGKMNANSIRIYTIHPPHFYKALAKYNEKNENPIYLFQGILIDENILAETLDAFKLDSILPFKEEIQNAIDVVHGNITLPEKPGHVSGEYTADVSPYLMGWIPGIEWQPSMVHNTNKVRVDKGQYDGTYVYTENAKPFENWLADIMDHILTYEMEKYNWQHPVSFTNYVSTDLLSHPYEPLEENDLVGINPNVIKFKNVETGYFASYHVYPYYPDFLNLDPKYTKYIDHRGKTNNYAGYLKDLISVHEIPVLIAEFGVPSSRGLTHVNAHGWDQGFLTEDEQGNILSHRFEDIVKEGYLGGIVSSWQDEWFKTIWNTMDFDNPNRRPYWSNAQTCEQQFGLLSFDRHKIKVDGSKDDWKKLKAKPIYSANKKDLNHIKNIYIDHDERYVYFGIEYKDLRNNNLDTLILLDTIPNQGNTTNPFNKNISTKNGMDFIIHITEQDDSKILVDSYYDTFYYQYGKVLKMYPENPQYEEKNNGIFNPIRLALNKEITIPKTGQKQPLIHYETGILRKGNGNPESPEYDSLADYYINKEDNFMEIRIPWLLLNFKDPSTKEIMGDMHINGLESKINIDGIKIAVAAYDTNNPENPDIFPRSTDGKISEKGLYNYAWDKWNEPIIKERLKKSYHILKDTFSNY
ncbi:hypothetical protein KQI42_19510 [Tissierella sp. MSJ-40]|uniref:Family 2 glycosyl transferase n=1 Tax=Tissierella simiarum TaxID=2841534 RepID=A0ABS6ECK4_9FIRM|nr:hypothetical protein [Tissierella simiarum]MBU5440185.1 hypothetical protein [Tissierella simiarum]